MRWLNERFAGLGVPTPGSQFAGEVHMAKNNQDRRLRRIRVVLDTSLYREFGAARVDGAAAGSAYRRLLEALGPVETLVGVTTNYDPSLEMGLEVAGMTPNTGFPRRFGQTPRLSPDGMVTGDGDHAGKTPVIHLHGAVGWYRQEDGEIVEHHQDQAYNETLGVPLVLYPDPGKDPTSDALVDALWRQFDMALERATHVLVLGHSLHDPALVARLRHLNPGKTRLAVCAYADPGYFSTPKKHKGVASEERTRVQQLLRSASVIPCSFGPQPKFDLVALRKWID
jgi:hypothetical protein